MQKSYNWAMMLIMVATVLFGLSVAGAAIDAISGTVGEGSDVEIVDELDNSLN